MMRKALLIFWCMLTAATDSGYYFTDRGQITFRSEASQELIKASSANLRGVLDPSKRTFVFRVSMRTFHGFNSALQREHFNEKYLETEKFPEASFQGKIIEDIDLTIDGNYEIRAKGKLTVHGVESERIIKCQVKVKPESISVESHFTILLSEHNIKIPKVVHEKIANEISVEVKGELKKRPG